MVEDISYTPQEVAKILRISKFTVYELIKRGELAAYRVGRKVRVDASDLEAYKRKTKKIAGNEYQNNCPLEADFFPVSEGLIISGQDVILDLLTRHMEKQMPNIFFLRQYTGSIDGLIALYKGKANAVTAHLWDSDTDDYNIAYVRRILPGQKTVIINLVYRMEGFYVAVGNPKKILDWPDLLKSGVTFLNREKGAGARVLLDEKLKVLGIDADKIDGYEHEELSHLAIASAVAQGKVDVGLGIEKAAFQVKGVDFIPLQKERYDLVIRKEDLGKNHFKLLLATLRSADFRTEVDGMGGYDTSEMGKIIAEL
ncbi:MAG: substrate-binding domain-containing protein [Peptococcaceae bacterium]